MKVLELFAGTRSIGKAFEAKGHEVFSVEWDKKFPDINLYKDISELTAEEVLDKFGKPDVVWLSPDCTSFSVAGISHHRRLNSLTGELEPISDYAKFCDMVDQHCLKLIDQLKPKFWFIENPVGGFRKMSWVQGLPRYTTTYCFSGDTKFITSEGHKTFSEMQNKPCQVLNINGLWENAIVRCYGVSQLYKITLSRSRSIYTIYTTANHLWYAATYTNKYKYNLVPTTDLKAHMLLPYALPHKTQISYELIPEFVCRGFIFGDGWVLANNLNQGSFVEFCNEKSEMIPWFDGFYHRMWNDDTKTCRVVKMRGFPKEWKLECPTLNNSASEIYSWIVGYFAADGSCSACNGQVSLSSAKSDNLQVVKELAEHIGIGTYQITSHMRKGYGIVETPLYQMTFVRKDLTDDFFLRKKHLSAYISHKTPAHQPLRYSVISVEPTDRYEPVFCCETEDTHTFTLENNIVTHNCRYGDERMKPTDIFTNHPAPTFAPPCNNGDPCHVAAPRGSRTGTQGLKNAMERSRIPQKLCEHIVSICEEYFDSQTTEHTPSFYTSRHIVYRPRKLF